MVSSFKSQLSVVRPDFHISRTITPRALRFGKLVELLKVIHNRFQVFQDTFTRAKLCQKFYFSSDQLEILQEHFSKKTKGPFFCSAKIGRFEPFSAKERENLPICIFEKIKILTSKNG